MNFTVTVATDQHTFIQFLLDLIELPVPHLTPVRVFLRGVFMVEIKRAEALIVTTHFALAAFVGNSFGLVLSKPLNGIFVVALLAPPTHVTIFVFIELGLITLATKLAPQFLACCKLIMLSCQPEFFQPILDRGLGNI
jgi:hypothetical protein